MRATSDTRHLSLSVEGMSCASCASRIEKAVKGVPGVTNVSVNLATDSVSVEAITSTDAQTVQEAIETAGYTVLQEETSILINGMTCTSCAARVDQVLRKVDGVTDARVNLATDQAWIRMQRGVEPP